jgi:hypothetical protein
MKTYKAKSWMLQQCAGIRPDVLPINTAMAKGVWFKPVQSHNYPNVTFPGKTQTQLEKLFQPHFLK